jgi:hypothetical protein
LEGGLIDRRQVALFIPPGLKKFKQQLFERIGATIGRVIRDDPRRLDDLPPDIIPIVGCTPFLRPWIERWTATNKTWIYWDRGYLRRVFATWLPSGADMGIPGGYYRWHINTPQMREIYNVPNDRWKSLRLDGELKPWRKSGRHIVVIDTLPDYWLLFSDLTWVRNTVALLREFTDRPIIVRDKESKVPLYEEIKGAHCVVSHGSIAAVEAVVMGCPVFVAPMSAAALVGKTVLADIENPIYPERQPWLNSLAYCQFNERELVDGTLWRLLK